MADDFPEEDFPDHVGEAVRSVTQLHSDHQGRATVSQRAINRAATIVGRPRFVALVGCLVLAWMLANLTAARLGIQAIDPPPFAWLIAAANLVSLFLVLLLLVAQKHEDELNTHRDTLTLELAILNEHKIAKVIQLLEELRRDSPNVHDRDDPQARQMSQPADAGSVLAAVRVKDEP